MFYREHWQGLKKTSIANWVDVSEEDWSAVNCPAVCHVIPYLHALVSHQKWGPWLILWQEVWHRRLIHTCYFQFQGINTSTLPECSARDNSYHHSRSPAFPLLQSEGTDKVPPPPPPPGSDRSGVTTQRSVQRKVMPLNLPPGESVTQRFELRANTKETHLKRSQAQPEEVRGLFTVQQSLIRCMTPQGVSTANR